MSVKTQKEILTKLGISKLNPMQEETALAVESSKEVILLSPTGSGKTLAFLLPLIAKLQPNNSETQALVLAPSRELAIQIEQVAREMGSGYKINVVYGGRPIAKDFEEVQHNPAILIGTPGRIADHLRRRTFDNKSIETIVLDEFDKSLEIGFEEDMKEIMEALPNLNQKILTSATQGIAIPEFVGIRRPVTIDYSLQEAESQLQIKKVVSPQKDKLETLTKLLCHLGTQSGIVFCNYKDSINRVSLHLTEQGIPHGCFYGGMEQIERERALIKFRNGTHRLIIATDLAARGLDIQELDYIIHYHLPLKAEEFTHRNGRTARMQQDGTAYVLSWQQDTLPDFIGELEEHEVEEASVPPDPIWHTLFISGGRKDKVSKGDIAGFLFRQAQLKSDEVGLIELKNDCAFVAVAQNRIKKVVQLTDNQRIKKRKVRVRVI